MFNNILNIQVWFKLNPYDEKIGPFRNIPIFNVLKFQCD